MSRAPDEDRRARGDVWVRRGCALLVAGVAAYSSYAHQRQFALAGGTDQISAALWPLSVDGLVILASLGLVRARSTTTARARLTLWLAFLLGVAVSLAANIAAAPTLTWQPVLVAGWPPLALLLAVELVVHSRSRDPAAETVAIAALSANAQARLIETETRDDQPRLTETETAHGRLPGTEMANRPTARAPKPRRPNRTSAAEAVMWTHFEAEQQAGRTPSGAELDRVAGTNNYGRAVLARWRRTGRVPAAATT